MGSVNEYMNIAHIYKSLKDTEYSNTIVTYMGTLSDYYNHDCIMRTVAKNHLATNSLIWLETINWNLNEIGTHCSSNDAEGYSMGWKHKLHTSR